jgi:mannose-1-phosphate guanylyltransferase/mannose-6-phosphate isomerase
VVAEDQDKKTIAILGVVPTTPETGYGYIQRNSAKGKYNEFAVAHFVEKPDTKTAQAYLADGNYLWNSGIFVLRASTWIAALVQYRPDIANRAQAAWLKKRSINQAVLHLFDLIKHFLKISLANPLIMQ